MKRSNILLFAGLLLIFLSFTFCRDKDKPKNDVSNPDADNNGGTPVLALEPAFPNLTFDRPVEFVSPADGTNRNFVIAQEGIIYTFNNDPAVKKAEVFLNFVPKVTSGGEMGLLGLAFHPDYKNNGYFYVNYTAGGDRKLHTVISRFKVSVSNPNMADPASEQILLTYDQPYSNHNGGKVAFGKDGYLYIAAGDGGSGGDPHRNGQNKKALLGKILRIDVNGTQGSLKYAIPSDNPFKGNSEGFREEIYAYGMRNPWRFSFDKETGDLWAGDVGQNKIEEIDIIKKGGNYGWNIMEADECFKSSDCNTKDLILPVYSYKQGPSTGNSVTGGYVYRGDKLTDLKGKYIYGDYVTGNIWALSNQNGKYTNVFLLKHDGAISSFGEDADNELYVCSYNDGKIYKFTSK
ncbi:PQQ-dependent sugar dehydrogenase [Rubrolithibacter danxiaensis]|uniref:PQQ-dependent sugar dehydrogenase n=1 Tax=Rubrolithibacter danxiaensis TaxID=3390805 RepID=UPI003BF8FC5E